MAKSEIKLPKITRLPSGAWNTYVMVDGKRHSITAPTKEKCAAEAASIKYRTKIIEDKQKSGTLTLAEAVDRYIEKRRGKISPSTLKGYESYRKNRLQFMMSANVFTTTDDQWQDAVDRDFANLSPKYARNTWNLFAGAVEAATKRRPDIELAPPDGDPRSFLKPTQIPVFVKAIQGKSAEIAMLLELSSLRISEVLDVRGTDVNLKENWVRVKGAAVYGPDGKLVHKKQNKTTKSNRYVPLIPPLKEALEKIELTDEYLVHMTSNGIFKQINRTCRELDFPEIGNHGLRHSFASLCYHLQIPLKIVQEMGGWDDFATVMKIYTHIAQEDIAERAKAFSDFFVAP